MNDNERSRIPLSPPWRTLWILLLLDALMILPVLGARTLWHIDEARFATVSREMAQTGDWLIPRIGGRVFASYPPFTYWTVAVSGSCFGWSEWAARVPSALAGILLIGLTGAFAWRLTGSAAAAGGAALVLATTPGFEIQQITCRADVWLALWMMSALYLFHRVAQDGSTPFRVLGFWLCLALGVLTKGPLGVLLPGFALGPWILVSRRWDMIPALRPVWGVPLLLAMTLPWYWVFSRRGGGEALEYNLLMENVHAFFYGFSHPRPFAYYFPRLAFRSLPWALFLPVLFDLPRERRKVLLPALGLLTMLAFFSISSNKRVNYLTYFYPLLAVIEGGVLAGLAERRWGRPVIAATGGLLTAAAGGFVVSLAVDPELWTTDIVRAYPGLLQIAGGVAAAIGLAVLGFALRDRLRAAVGMIGAGLAAGFILYAGTLNAETDQEGRRGVAFCRSISEFIPAGEVIGAMGLPEEAGYYYYSSRKMVNIPDAAHFRASGLTYGFSYEADRPGGARILTQFKEESGHVLYLWTPK